MTGVARQSSIRGRVVNGSRLKRILSGGRVRQDGPWAEKLSVPDAKMRESQSSIHKWRRVWL